MTDTTLAPVDPIYDERLDIVMADMASAGAGGAVISAPADVTALSGTWVDTGIISGRDPWLLVGADRSVVLLVQEHEAEVATGRCRIDLADISRYSGPARRQELVTAWAARHALRRVTVGLAEMSAADDRVLAAHGIDLVDHGPAFKQLPRRKSRAEIELIESAAVVLADTVEQVGRGGGVEGATEFDIASRIAAHALRASPLWGSLVPITSSGENLMVAHARPSARRLSAGDLCRIGARGKFGPFNVMHVRSLVVADGSLSADAQELAGLRATHAATLASLQIGAPIPIPDVSPPGHTRVGVPAAQGMGFRFKEPPLPEPSDPAHLMAGDTLLATTILEQSSGARLYWQEMAAVDDSLRRLGYQGAGVARPDPAADRYTTTPIDTSPGGSDA